MGHAKIRKFRHISTFLPFIVPVSSYHPLHLCIMQIYSEIAPLQAKLAERRVHKERIGLVPTMGALHDGHQALLTRSLRDNDHTVCSIYVNPTQFNNPDDLTQYPRTLEQDTALLKALGCHTLFCPNDPVMYPYRSVRAPILRLWLTGPGAGRSVSTRSL